MGTGKYCLIVIGFLACSTSAAAADGLCLQLRAFNRSEPQQASERRWFEFHWGFDHDHDTIWSWGCRHSDDNVAKATCKWLVGHTNQEFSMILPQAIMTCYGYDFPKFAQYDWASIAGTITLRGDDEHRLVMDLSYRDLPNGEVAVRVAREVLGQGYEPDTLPPIQPMSKVDRASLSTGR